MGRTIHWLMSAGRARANMTTGQQISPFVKTNKKAPRLSFLTELRKNLVVRRRRRVDGLQVPHALARAT